jgi:hypothetical protein
MHDCVWITGRKIGISGLTKTFISEGDLMNKALFSTTSPSKSQGRWPQSSQKKFFVLFVIWTLNAMIHGATSPF